MAPLLEVVGLRTHIKLRTSTVHAVDGLSFTVNAGETVGIVGESGSGKTMAAMSIMKLLPPAARVVGGQINFDGRDLAQMSDKDIRKVRGNEIAMIFQDPMTSLNPTMNIGNQISESVVLHRGVSKSDGLKRAAEVLELVGLPRPKERLKDYPHQLSGGLRQRVMIAMALACDPKLLIADEPTTALDVTIQAQILSLLDRIKRDIGMGIILITHDMGVIAGRADRVVVMYAGEKIETAETGELFTHVRHPYTEALLASIPKLDQDKTQALYSIPGIPPDLRKELTACRFAPRCAFATEKCRTETPVLVEASPGHEYQCFFPREATIEDIAAVAEELIEQAEHNEALVEEFGSDIAILDTTEADVEADAIPPVDAPFVLEFRDVVKEFPISRGFLGRNPTVLHAVSDVTIGVRKGETFGLVGESGCGKTTLGRMGTALEEPSEGAIIFNGQDMSEMKGSELREKRRDIQFMFQDPYASLDPRMRVQEIISEPLTVARRGSSAERNERVRGLMDQVGLPQDALERYPHEFSGGQRQRLGLARAMALNPSVIIADEPVSALDVSVRSQVLNLMKRVQAANDLTYVIISHDLSVVRYMADRIGVMYLGKIVETGTSDEIYDNPAHPYTAGLLEAIPLPDPVVAKKLAAEGAPIRGELPSPINPPSGCRFRTRCPRAQDLCASTEPPLRSFGGEHRAACHFPLHEPVEADSSGAAA